MDKKKVVKKKVVKKKVVKDIFYLVTDIRNPNRDTAVIPFDDVEEFQEYLVEELEGEVSYDFDNGDDILIRGKKLTVKVTEKTFKVNVK